jgi:hypothetical protein
MLPVTSGNMQINHTTIYFALCWNLINLSFQICVVTTVFFPFMLIFLPSDSYGLLLQPSLWYKPCVEAVPSDPARATQEQLSLDGTGNNCSLILSVNHSDSDAPNAMVEHLPVHSTKGCDNLIAEMMSCLASNGGPESSNSAGAIGRRSPSVQPEGTSYPKQIMSPGNSAAHCAKKPDSCAARVAPIVHCGLRTISGKSSAPGGEVCNSVTPTTGPVGYASLAPSDASKIHGSSASGSTSKGCESVVPSLALGIPKSTGVKRLSSSSRLKPEVKGFLSLRIASQRPAVHSIKGQDSLTPVVIPSVHASGKPLYQLNQLYSTPSCVED